MNDIRDLLPGRMRERTFQLKAKRDAGAIWHEPQEEVHRLART